MNNRYLYRAKRIDNEEWVEGNIITCNDRYFIVPKFGISCIEQHKNLMGDNTISLYAFEVDPSTICRCTGSKDKNSKLIWENDIVDGHIKRGAAFYRCKVLWNECKARFDVRAIECNFPMTLDECADDISICGLDYEVIGNIFDNPELLEVRE